MRKLGIFFLFSLAGWSQNPTQAAAGTAANVATRNGNTLIVLGDSIAGASTSYTSVTDSLSWTWPNQVNIRSKQQIRYLYNAGVAGDKCSDMLTRNQSTVIGKSPAVAALECGTNDVGNSIAFTTTTTNITSILTAWIAAGIKPVLCTIPPRTDSDTYILPILKVNAWIRKYAAANGITLVDFYSILVDPANAHYRAGLAQGDGIHPIASTHTSMADYFISKVSPLFPSFLPTIAMNGAASDTLNMLTNSMFLLGGAAPTGWSFSGNNCTHSSVANNVPPGGNWFQFACTNLGTDEILFDCGPAAGTCSGQWSVGDKLAFSGTINTSGVNAGSLIYTVRVDCLNGTTWQSVPMNQWTIDTSGTFYMDFIVTTGTTDVRPHLDIVSGTGTVQIAQWSLVNLTTQGLL